MDQGRAIQTLPEPPVAKSAPLPRRKRSGWRNMLAVACSAFITAAASYLFIDLKGLAGVQIADAINVSNPSMEPAPAPARSAPTVTLGRATEDALLERASNQMIHGDGVGARAVYEVLAHYGSPKGAFNLAETYDPAALARRPARGLAPDIRLAREWYAKAAELGSPDASERLKNLDSPGSMRR
jgi:hypothetical protein